MKPLISLLISLVLIATASCQESRTVKVTVTEEDGTLVEGAQVSVWYMGYRPGESKEDKGNTDVSGVFTANGIPLLRMEVTITKEGYYTSRSGRLSRKKDHDVAFILRKMKNPIPLYAKRLQTLAPVVDKEFGYDCEVGNWVAPYGKGKVSDLIFKASAIRNVNRYSDYHHELSVRFSRKLDGFVKFDQSKISELKSPYQAPGNTAIYKPSWTYFKKRTPSKKVETNADPDRGYFFRFRTEVDANGNIISCHYAKAYGDIPDMKMYFNSTPNDKNLEFDPQRNLFQDLDSTEQVREP